MPLSLALVLSFSQHLSEFSLTASQAGYRGLVRVLRAHPRLKFNLRLSGTLLHALNWLDPGLLAEVRAGAARGQFELVAGPYADNVLAASDDWDNARQIALGRDTLKTLFDVEAAGLWNPGRCWRQSLASVIAEAGCRWTLIEDHLLHESGAQNPLVFTTRHAGRRLTVFYDDSILRARVQYAAWTGRTKQVFDYLERIAERPDSRRFCLAYAGEAEALGLWPWQAGLAPQQTWANFDKFLTELEAHKGLKTIHLSRAPAPARELTPIREGSGVEVDRALLDPAAPGHEPGYADWRDFASRAPKLARIESLYASLRGRLRQLAAPAAKVLGDASESEYTPPPTSRSPLLQQAIHTLCSHQYRFGFPGIGGTGYRGWEGARAGFVLLRAAELAAKPRAGLWIEDVNGDGSDEVVLCDGRQLAVASPSGARLLYWFDLAEGRQWIGNPLAVTDAPFLGDSLAPQPKPMPRVWLPEGDSASLAGLRGYKIKEAPPTRLGKYLPEWVWQGATKPVTFYARPDVTGDSIPPRRAGQRAFNDRVSVGGQALAVTQTYYRIEGETVAFSLHFDPDLVLVKRFRLAEDGVQVNYRLENRAGEARSVRLRVASELCPDYAETVNGGRAALEYVLADDVKPGVRNNRTGRSVILAASRLWARLERAEGLLALEVALTFEIDLAAQTAQTFDLKLSALRLQTLAE